jgi:predicted AAA+ superfamily ATPase
MNTTNNALRSVLADWFSRPAAELGCLRDLGGYELGVDRQIAAVIGPRRSGKSTVCRQAIQALVDSGVPQTNIVYINFEDERLLPAGPEILTMLPDVFRELVDVQAGHQQYFFLDEIQNVPAWSQWVRRMTEGNRQVRIVLTGSSSRLLSNEIATELRGRADTVEIFPFSFHEYLLFKNQLPSRIDKLLLFSLQAPKMVRHFIEYLVWGGFPERFQVKDVQSLLQGYFRAMFVRDMIERFGIKQTRMFGDYLKVQLQRFASLSSYSALAGDLRAIGFSAAKTTIAEYLDHARDGFLLFSVPIFAYKVTEQLRNPQKVYAIDNGLVRSIRFSATEDDGRYLENLVYLELRRRRQEIFYHGGSAECDFVIADKGCPKQAIQVCWDCSQPQTLARELRGILDAMDRFKISEGIILTRHEAREERIGKATIQILPVWWWALHQAK